MEAIYKHPHFVQLYLPSQGGRVVWGLEYRRREIEKLCC
jgi:hypothetical protein